MKRLFFILLFFGAFCLFACQRDYGLLEYQNGDLVAECRVNGKYTVEIAKAGQECTVTVLEPESARGIAFTVGEGVTAWAEGTELQMARESLGGICALAGIFFQNEETLTSAVQKGEGSELTFQTDKCVYQFSFGKGNLPKSVDIWSENFRYEVEILSVEMK